MIYAVICLIAFIILRVVWKIGFGMLAEKAEWGSEKTVVCPNCGHDFSVSYKKLYFSRFRKKDEYMLNINDRNKLVLKCPSCNKTDLCVMKDG